VLLDGWQRANAIYRDQARIDASTLAAIESAESVALQVVESYIDHRRHRFLLTVADDNIASHRRILKLVNARLSGGSGTQSEVDLVEERLYAAQAVRAEVQQAAYEADAKFKAAVGIEPSNTHRVAYPKSLPGSREAAVSEAMSSNSAIAARKAEAEAMGFEYERTKGEALPTLSLEGSAQRGHDLNGISGRNDDYSVKLKLAWRLYDGGARNARVGEASALASEAMLKRDLQVRDVTQAIETTWGKLVASGERLSAVSNQVNAAKRVAASYSQEFEAGKRSLLDLLEAENSVFTSRFEEASVSGVRLFSAYYLKALTGTLLSSLGVAAPVGEVQYRNDLDSGRLGFGLKIEPLR
jgi:adhesin transport system outer membrane protein